MPTATARAMEKNCFMVGSVTVGNVPDAPSGVKVFIREGAAKFTLTLLLLHHLKSNASQFRGGSEDAVGIELNFVHGSIIDTGWGHCRPLVDSSKFVQHLLHLCRVDVWGVVGETVARLRDTMEHQQVDAVLPGIGTASDVVEELIILQPQGRIPGLPVCPSVECGVGHVFV